MNESAAFLADRPRSLYTLVRSHSERFANLMTNVYSLETLKADLDREFAPLQLDLDGETYTLRNLMRINEKDREAVLASLDEIQKRTGDDDNEDKEQSPEDIAALSAAVSTVLRSVTGQNKGDKLVAWIDGDLMLSMKVIELWTGATQPGEAENSSA